MTGSGDGLYDPELDLPRTKAKSGSASCGVCRAEAGRCVAGGDVLCHPCERLLSWFRNRFAQAPGVRLESITTKTRLAEDLGADSLEDVDLIMDAERGFGVSIPDRVAERTRTVGDFLRMIRFAGALQGDGA